MKRTWTTPQLVELVRGTPEEAVLIACKTAGLPGAGLSGTAASPSTAAFGCMQTPTAPVGSCGPSAPNGSLSAVVACVSCNTAASS
jgi:hypothetical protein